MSMWQMRNVRLRCWVARPLHNIHHRCDNPNGYFPVGVAVASVAPAANSRCLRLRSTAASNMSTFGTRRTTNGPSHLRRFFDKVMRDGAATFDPRKDGPKFLRAACSEFADDPVDLLYRLDQPRVGSSTSKNCNSLKLAICAEHHTAYAVHRAASPQRPIQYIAAGS